MGRNLTNLYISESFNHVLQVSGSDVQNGLGESVSGTTLNINVVSASYAVSASHEIIKEVSSSYADYAPTASLGLRNFVDVNVGEGNLTFIAGDGAETVVPISVTGSVSSSLSSSYAATADQVKVVNDTTNNARYITYVDVTSGRDDLRAESQFTYNPFTNTLNVTNVNGNAATATLATNATYADNTITTGKNLEATEIAKGTPLYFTGSGTAGNLVGIYRADAGNPARMPAGGIAGEDIASGAEGNVLLDGYIGGVDTSLFAPGDKVYVGVGGGYTNSAPTGSSNKVQFLGNVEKSSSNGSGVINMMGEARALPNVQQGSVWVGGTGDVPSAIATGSLSVGSAASATSASHAVNADSATSATSASHALVSDTVNDTNIAYQNQDNSFTGTQTFDNIAVNGTGSFAYIQQITGSAKIIGDAYIILNNDTPTERYAGIVVQDSGSGSPNTTASLEFDGQSNDWFYEYSNDGGVTTDHGIVIFGPEYDTKGSPTYLTSNTIPKSSGSHHIVDSNISDDGSTISLGSNTEVTGFVKQTFTAPTTYQEKAFVNVSGATINGISYDRVFFGIADYPPTDAFEDYFAIEYYDSFGYNFGSEFSVNGAGGRFVTLPSGSGYGQRAVVETFDNYDGSSKVDVYANTVNIGNQSHTNVIDLGHGGASTYLKGSTVNSLSSVSTLISSSGTITLDAPNIVGTNVNSVNLGDATGNINLNGVTILSSSGGFPLQVDGTMDVRRIHFSKNPFNDLENGDLGAIRLSGDNMSFYSTMYNSDFNQASQSVSLLHLDSSSLQTYAEIRSDFAGTEAKFKLVNANGTRSAEIDVDSLSVSGSATFHSTITGSISTAYNNNTNSGSLGFWQGTQAEYDLISGSASDSIIYFVI